MSDQPKKKRKTRLKGTETMKPCVDCGELKNRFTAFKPRWSGCKDHKTERGRRYYQPDCEPCKLIVNGNIRQPRCIECDAKRPKRRSAPKPEPTPTVEQETPTVAEPVTVEAPLTEAARESAAVEQTPVVEVPLSETSPEDLNGLPEPSPVVATKADLSRLFGGVFDE